MNAKKIKTFVKQTSLNAVIKSLIMEPCPEGAKISVRNEENTIFLVGILNGLTLKEKLPIKSTKDFMDALDWVGGDVTLEKVENKLFISSTNNGKVRSQEIGLASIEYVEKYYLATMPEFEYEGSMNVDTSDLSDISRAFEKLGDQPILIKVEDNKLTFKAEGDTDNTKIEIPVEYYNCQGYFGSP